MTDQTTASLEDRVQAAVRDALRVVAQNPAAGPDVAASFVASAVLAEVHRQPAGQAPDTDRAGLREQIADALARMDAEKWGVEIPPRDHPFWQMYPAQADAVLAVLPAPADRAAVAELAQAIRLTREYVGEELLPAVEGWSWYDALRRHAPHELPDEAAPAVVSAVPGQADNETTDEARCTCADAGACFAPAGHYADCPQAAEQPAAGAQQPDTAS